MRSFGIGGAFSIEVRERRTPAWDGPSIILTLSPALSGHVRDAAYHLVDGEDADDWDEAACWLLRELADALSDPVVELARRTERDTRDALGSAGEED